MFGKQKKKIDPTDRVVLYRYHYADRLNPKLYDIIKDLINTPAEIVQGGCARTSIDLNRRGIPEIDNILRWVKATLPEASWEFAGGMYKGDEAGTGGKGGYKPNNFEIDTCWGMLYNKGTSVESHNHFPYPMAFVYYVNTPEGCAPTIMRGKELNPNAGEMLMFMGHHYHSVPSSEVDGRCVLSGLINYNP